MIDTIRDRWSGWGTRLSFGALLLVFSEWVIWQEPTGFTVLEWAGLALVYLAFAAAALDLMARLYVRDVLSLLMLAGLYGLVNATLISHITARDLPSSLFVRPLAAQPLAFLGAYASFQILASGRATGPLDFLVALIAGLAWGVWVRWFPEVAEEAVPRAEIETALPVLAVLLLACGVLRLLLPPSGIYNREDWMLMPFEWAFAGGVLIVALVIGNAQGAIGDLSLAIMLGLGSFLGLILYMAGMLRRGALLLASITPPRTPNIVAWVILLPPFLVLGWVGYNLGGSGESALQSDILFGLLALAGAIWLPIVSIMIGVRAFVQLAREQG
jgi:hypothetical protein